jgi:protein kinase-like protein
VPPSDSDETRLQTHGSGPVRTPSGWTTTTDEISHGRFAPGALLDQRYRIVGRLGRGGMGEVYRADDLRLGQQVALKFLPEDIDRDAARLMQLHTEVRMARQVSHPNVCRVYDVGEFEGHTFISMEYVDGEDLASLLRRIGRFSQDRGIELARQICAGLAAAHDRGVVHRDLKPANIMLDGNGRIRITDFGLAGASGESLRAGTPAYMAPEQLAGAEVTPRSDIYSLGLVLYEVFTGRRALDGTTLAEILAKREQGDITRPSALVRDLDEAIERTILRCLEQQPTRRPASALGVAAALPGGDPLAAALAAGETPSPEMVAAADTGEALSIRAAVLASASVVAMLIAIVLLDQHVLLLNRVPMPKTPDALVDRAQDVVAKLGWSEAAKASASSMGSATQWLRYVGAASMTARRWEALRTVRPSSVVLWYRTSPMVLIPRGLENRIDVDDPPLTSPGMTVTFVDTAGRLAQFVAVPDSIQSQGPHPPANWSLLFDAAALPMSSFHAVAPERVPATFADERAAWEGPLPERPDLTVRVEAAAFAGRPVFFGITGPWNRAAVAGTAGGPSTFERVILNLTIAIMPALMIIGAALARRNVKLGRGDRRGAFRAAAALFFLLLCSWLLGDRHVAYFGNEIDKFFMAVSQALFGAAVLWLTYLGLEPYVRRFSPSSLIGWTRLLSGGWRDPRVGRDVLIGVCAGLAMTVIVASHNLLPTIAGRPEAMPRVIDPAMYLSFRFPFAIIFDRAQEALFAGMLGVVGYTALYIVLKRRLWAAIVAMICYTPVAVQGMFMPGTPLLDLGVGLAIVVIFVAVIARAGVLPTISCLVTHFTLLRAPLTTEISSWRGPYALVFVGLSLALGLAAAGVGAGRLQAKTVSASGA